MGEEHPVTARRLQRLMTQSDLADRAGVSTRTIERAEAGARLRPITKQRIAVALGCKYEELWPRHVSVAS